MVIGKFGMYLIGLFFVILGLAFLLRTLGIIYFPGSFWSLFWPFIFIGAGAAVICLTHKGRQLVKKIRELLDFSEKAE